MRFELYEASFYRFGYRICITVLNTVLPYRIKRNKYGIVHFISVLWIQDMYPDSRIRIFSSRIKGRKDSGSASKNLGIFNLKTCYLTSREYSGCSSRITDPGSWYFSIPDPGVKKAPVPDPGYATLLYIFTARKLYTVRYLPYCHIIYLNNSIVFLWSNISLKIVLRKSIEICWIREAQPNEHKGSTWLENLGHED